MGMRRYLKDYRLENVPGKNGKLRTVAVYCGKWYVFTGNAAQVRTYARSFALLAAAQVALAAMALFTNARCSRVFYVMVPFAFILIPLFLVCAGALNLITAKSRLTNETNDHIRTRTRACPIALMILSGISALAHIPYAINFGETLPDVAYLAAALGIFATALAQQKISPHFVTAEDTDPKP